MVKIRIDAHEIDVPAEYTLIQACEEAGIEIPRFCYHERLSVAGNCRMCLVEVKGFPKPQASCALNVRDLRGGPNGELPQVITQSDTVKRAREGVMEFLLINHPLDCPICDQGGECDLQDQAVAYGHDSSRFDFHKRAVEDKDFGPLIKTVMTRCIQCTRCVRFATEVAGVPELGAIGRGEDSEITPYIDQIVTSELSANVIDLCPVGALTSKPTAFMARSWEFRKTETIDIMDAMMPSIRVDSRGNEVIRVLPRLNEEINEEWISNKTRYVVDGLKRQRLDRPYVRREGRLVEASWEEALSVIASRLTIVKPDQVGVLAGDLCDIEQLYAAKKLFSSLGITNLECRQDGAFLPRNMPALWQFNTTIAGIDQADALLLVGTNPRQEAPLLNARIRKRWLNSPLPIFSIGEVQGLTYDYHAISAQGKDLGDLSGILGGFADILRKAQNPVMIVGMGVLQNDYAPAILSHLLNSARELNIVRSGYNGFNVLQTVASRLSALHLDFLPQNDTERLPALLNKTSTGAINTLYLLGADEFDTHKIGAECFVIYQGSHGDKAALRADVILPTATYTEKDALYMNIEGRVQRARRAVHPVGMAKEDWAVLRALSAECQKTLPFDSLAELRTRLISDYPVFAQTGMPLVTQLPEYSVSSSVLGDIAIKAQSFDFYQTNPIARASRIMAECSEALNHSQENIASKAA